MTAALTTTGLSIDTYEDIKAAVEEYQHAYIDAQLNVTASSVIGQLNAIISQKLSEVQQVLQAIYDAMDPNAATGSMLDNIALLAPGILRHAGAKATCTCTCILTAGTYAIGTLVMRSSVHRTVRYANSAEVVVATGGAITGIAFEAESIGEQYNLPMSELTEISQPVSGWTLVVATTDALGGLDTETDYDFRIRRLLELRRSGGSHIDAIGADVLNVPGVSSVYVEENDTDATVGTLPPHSIHVTYYDDYLGSASEPAVGLAIAESKAAGIATSGALSEVITTTYGDDVTILFDRATVRELAILITGIVLKASAPTDPGPLIAERLLAVVNGGYDYDGITQIEGLGINGDVIIQKIIAAVASIPWVSDFTSLQICWDGGTPGSSNLTVSNTEIAHLDVSNVTTA